MEGSSCTRTPSLPLGSGGGAAVSAAEMEQFCEQEARTFGKLLSMQEQLALSQASERASARRLAARESESQRERATAQGLAWIEKRRCGGGAPAAAANARPFGTRPAPLALLPPSAPHPETPHQQQPRSGRIIRVGLPAPSGMARAAERLSAGGEVHGPAPGDPPPAVLQDGGPSSPARRLSPYASEGALPQPHASPPHAFPWPQPWAPGGGADAPS